MNQTTGSPTSARSLLYALFVVGAFLVMMVPSYNMQSDAHSTLKIPHDFFEVSE